MTRSGNSSEEDEVANRMLSTEHSPNENTKDKYYTTFILFYALGTLTQVPQNFFITANDYWMYKFRDTQEPWNYSNSNNRTELQTTFTSSYSIVSNVTSVIILALTIVLSKYMGKKITIQRRLIFCLLSLITLFCLTLIFVDVNTDTWQQGFFVLSLITGALLSGVGALFIVSLFQLSAKFPARYLGAQLTGQAICGIFAALVQIFTIGVSASSQVNALIYFTIGGCCVLGTSIYYLYVLRTSAYYQYNANKEKGVVLEKPTLENVLSILKRIKYLLTTMIIVLGTSIMLHPAVTSLVKSVGEGTRWSEDFFVPVSTFLVYNLFDLIGRETAGALRKPTNEIFILACGIIRLGFIPLLMFCNAQPRSHLPVAINSDAAYIVFIIIFAFTNGFFVNLCIIRVPTVTAPGEAQISMFLIVIFMVVSLGACSFFGILIVKVL